MDNQNANLGSGADACLVLQMVARSLGSSVSQYIVHDANATPMVIDRPLRENAASVGPLTRRIKTALLGHAVELMSNEQFIAMSIRGRFQTKVISINRTDRIMLTKPTEIMIANGRLRVYARKPELRRHESALLDSRRAQELVASIIANREDSVHLYANEIACYLFEPRSSDVVLRILHDMVALAECLEIGSSSETEKVRLPAQFSSLTPLADRWCLSDDTEREDAIEAASEDDLKILIAIVKPRLEEINAYLDENGTPDDEAAALGILAECAVEAELHFADRRS